MPDPSIHFNNGFDSATGDEGDQRHYWTCFTHRDRVPRGEACPKCSRKRKREDEAALRVANQDADPISWRLVVTCIMIGIGIAGVLLPSLNALWSQWHK